MNWNEKTSVKIAVLDLNNGHENQGMRCIRQIINDWGVANSLEVLVEEFDVRVKNEIPSTDFDAYISSGGPGSPLESEGSDWENSYFNWIGTIESFNAQPGNFPKKPVFFICHSYQLATRYFKVANVCKRKSNSFGVFPMHLTSEGMQEETFEGLKNPFYAVDSRDFQVIEPNIERLHELGGKILAMEKERPHVPFDRAVMAMRFTENFIGTQFHPEADAIGMSMYLQRDDKKNGIIQNFGEAKWSSMLDQLNDPDKILYTYAHILPNFLNNVVEQLVEA